MPVQRTHTTSRDIDILRSVGLARYLSAAEIEWLHFAGRDDAKWRATHAAAIGARRPLPKPSATVTRRINGLVSTGHLTRIRRVAASGTSYIALPAAYMLTRGGQETIEYRRMLDDDQADPGDYATYRPHRTDQDNYGIRRTLDHDIQIGRLYAAVHVQLAYTQPGTSINSTWTCLMPHSSNADRSYVGLRDVAVMPDATFALNGMRYLVEVETGSNRPNDVVAKLEMYRNYAGSTALRDRYGVRDFVVLWVVSSEARRITLAKRISADVTKAVATNAALGVTRPQAMRDPAEVRAECYARHRIITAKHVHPLTIRESWQVTAPNPNAAGCYLAEAPLW